MKTTSVEYVHNDLNFKITSRAVNGILTEVTIIDVREEHEAKANILALFAEAKKPVYRASNKMSDDTIRVPSILPVIKDLRKLLDEIIMDVENDKIS